MFEEYLHDTVYFIHAARESEGSGDLRGARRFYRAAAMVAVAALETYVNYVASTLEKATSGGLNHYELALLLDKRFGQEDGHFRIQRQSSYSRLEDKLRFLIMRFSVGLNLGTSESWSHFMTLKQMRDGLVHSRDEEDNKPLEEYESECSRGLSACVEIMNHLSQGIFSRPLRAKLLDLAPV